MGHQIVEMPNGNLAIWSTVVDDWIMTDATDREVIDYERVNGASLDRVELAVERARGRIEPIHYGGYPPATFERLDNWRRLMHERVQCAECGHDEIAHDGGQGPCDRDDEGCECAEFEAPTANANASPSASSMTPGGHPMTDGTRWRKKPVVVEAQQLTEGNSFEVAEWCQGRAVWVGPGVPGIVIQTLEGDMTASVGDWIIRGVQGEFYPCKPDIFAATYEPAAGGGQP